MEILSLGNKIKRRRKELNLTLKELAGDRVTPAQLSYVETDKCKPSLDLLEYVSERLGVEIDYLLESEKKQVVRFCKYNLKLVHAYILNGKFNDARNRLMLVQEASESYKIEDFTGEIYMCLGDMHYAESDYCSAFEKYIRSLKLFSCINDNENVANIYIKLGLISYNRKDYTSCAVYFNQAKKFAEMLYSKSVLLKVKVYYYLSVTYRKLRDDLNLSECVRELFKVLEIVCDGKKYGDILLEEALKQEDNLEFDRAYKMADQSFDMYRLMDYATFIGKIQTNMGEMDAVLKDDAISCLNKAVNIKKACNDETLPLTLIATARYRTNKKEYEMALDAVNDALNMAIRDNRRDYEALSYYQLFKIYNERGECIKAEDSIRRCIDILEYTGDNRKLPCCYYELGLFYNNIKREKESLDYINKCLNMLDTSNGAMKI